MPEQKLTGESEVEQSCLEVRSSCQQGSDLNGLLIWKPPDARQNSTALRGWDFHSLPSFSQLRGRLRKDGGFDSNFIS